MIRKQVSSIIAMSLVVLISLNTTALSQTDTEQEFDTQVYNEAEATLAEPHEGDIYFDNDTDLFAFDFDEAAFSDHLRTIELSPTKIPWDKKMTLLMTHLNNTKNEIIAEHPVLCITLGVGTAFLVGGTLYYLLTKKNDKK